MSLTTTRRVQLVQIGAWLLSGLVTTLSIVVWGQNYDWQLSQVSSYQFFPVLGLLAFSLMWAHYVAGAAREMLGVDKQVLRPWLRYTGYAVLICLFLHPGLLIYQLFRDGAGLPPGSYVQYVGPGLGWVAMLGSVSLLVFLAFEFHRVFGQKSWWHWVADASDVAMLAILYHGLRLGSDLQQGWFTVVWWLYGIVFIAILIRKYTLRILKRAS